MLKSYNNKNYNYFKLLVIALIFLLLNFDPKLSRVYLLILVADYFWYQNDNHISFPYKNPNRNFLTDAVEAIVAFGLFLGATAFLFTGFSTQSLVSLLSSTVPILADSQFLTLLSWGVIVPMIESNFFFGRLLEGFSTFAEKALGRKIDLEQFSMPLFVVMLFVSSIFTLYHLTAKSLSPTALMITFIFGLMSMFLVIKQKSTRGAIIMHVLSNSLAVLVSMGWTGGFL